MSDPRSNYGEPVQEPVSDNDVVGRARDSLADAEAAQLDAVGASDDEIAGENASPVIESDPSSETADRAAPVDEPIFSASPTTEPADTQPEEPAERYEEPAERYEEPAERYEEPTVRYDAAPTDATSEERAVDASDTQRYDAPEPDAEPAAVPADTDDREVADTVVDEPVPERYDTVTTEPAPDVNRYDTVDATPVAVASEPVGAQPIFVQAPEAPRPRGNRGAAGAIGLLAALAFAVLYLAAGLLVGVIDGTVTGANVLDTVLAALGTWALWVPVVVFLLAFWLLGAIINRGRWGAWVIFGILVGLASYGGHLLGQLFQAPFWTLTARQGGELVEGQLLAPLAIAAFVIGRELTIWFGAWVAARGRRMTELNVEARREYERTLEAGPQLARL